MAINELIKELDLNLQVNNYEVLEDRIILHVSSLLHKKPCPHCGLESSSIHAYYIHTFSDLPIQGKETIIKLTKRKFRCLNPECKYVTFSDNYNFVDKKAKKTKRLLDEILKASLTQSSVSATKYLNSVGIQIRKSSICNYIKKKIPEIDKKTIRLICIDDFAIKKRHKYGTIMINIETGKIVDILGFRDADSVTKWLKNYPKVKYASRDGSLTYAKAITNANEKINQITDRFHLIKGLCDGIVKYFQSTIPGRISIPITDESKMLISVNYNTMNRLEKAEYVKSLYKKGYTASEIHRQVGTNMATIKKYLDLSDEEIKESKTTSKERDHLKATQKVVKKVLLVKKIYKETNSIRAVSRITGISIAKIKDYLKEDFNPINAHYGISRGGVLPKYKNEIFTMKSEGKTSIEISQYIKSQGYSITDAAIRAYIAKERRIIKDLIGQNSSPKETIERSIITSLLYHPLSKVKRLTEKQYSEIIKIYPIIDDIYNLVNTFKEILVNNTVRKLNSWIKKAISLNIDEITSFTEALKKDIIAVKNAIKLPYSNGLAEGSVNKLKLIKRIMYGRSSFDTLRKKALLREYFFSSITTNFGKNLFYGYINYSNNELL